MAQKTFIDISWAILFFPPPCHLLIVPRSSSFSHHHPLVPLFVVCRHPDACLCQFLAFVYPAVAIFIWHCLLSCFSPVICLFLWLWGLDMGSWDGYFIS